MTLEIYTNSNNDGIRTALAFPFDEHSRYLSNHLVLDHVNVIRPFQHHVRFGCTKEFIRDIDGITAEDLNKSGLI